MMARRATASKAYSWTAKTSSTIERSNIPRIRGGTGSRGAPIRSKRVAKVRAETLENSRAMA